MIQHISAVIIVKNGEATLSETLCSLASFKEVVLYDNDSTDDTLKIAERFSNVVLHQGTFKGFGKTKQAAVKLASNDWVLSLDVDECASPKLVQYLQSWNFVQSEAVVGVIPRYNYLMGKQVKYGGWGNDHLVRLFNRKVHNFNDNDVHESIDTGLSTVRVNIPYAIHHNAVQRIGQFLEKVNLYTEIRRETSSKTYLPVLIFCKAIWRFFESYILRAGFLSGWRGLVVAWSKANEVFFKYIKIYADKETKL
ncbi:MAG: glycosyltransferase involved in cell wall biosynthesis [Oleiphilaceae bacterium]|jgi:glycosyltransferase involved in cell wall biosynthesis